MEVVVSVCSCVEYVSGMDPSDALVGADHSVTCLGIRTIPQLRNACYVLRPPKI